MSKRWFREKKRERFYKLAKKENYRSQASALLRRFSSVAGIRAASEDELRQVAGIGPVLARKIKEVLV